MHDADLVLCSELSHVASIVDTDRDAFRKTFLLLELADMCTARLATESFDDWLTRLNRHRSPSDLLSRANGYNLGDPYGCGRKTIARTVDHVLAAAGRIIETAAGRHPSTPRASYTSRYAAYA